MTETDAWKTRIETRTATEIRTETGAVRTETAIDGIKIAARGPGMWTQKYAALWDGERSRFLWAKPIIWLTLYSCCVLVTELWRLSNNSIVSIFTFMMWSSQIRFIVITSFQIVNNIHASVQVVNMDVAQGLYTHIWCRFCDIVNVQYFSPSHDQLCIHPSVYPSILFDMNATSLHKMVTKPSARSEFFGNTLRLHEKRN